MKKALLTKLMLLLCALIAGSSSVWAGTYTLIPNQANTGSSATTYITSLTEFEYGGITWQMNQWNPSTLQIKTNQSSATGEFRFYNSSAFPGKITSVVIKFSSLTLSNTETTGFMFVGGSSAVTATTGGTNGTWNSTDKTITWTPDNTDNFTYFAFYQNGKVATSSNYLASSDAIVVTFEGENIQTCATPSFSPTEGTFPAAQNVTLSCSTDGATIRYTTDGSNPTKTSSAYSSAIPVSSTTTIKAKAFKNGMASSVIASATYTIVPPSANIAELTENTNTSAETKYVTLTDAVVTFTNGYYAYIQDASGAILYYKNGHGLTAGDVLNGTATVTYKLNNSNPQITDLSGITPTDGVAPSPTSLKQSEWTYTFNDVLSQYFQITGATITSSNSKYYVSLGGENVQLYRAGTDIGELNLTKKYTITGFPTLFNTTKELQIFAAPSEEASSDPIIAATPTSLTGFSYLPGNGPSAAKNISVSGSNLEADISLSASTNYEMCLTENGDYTNSLTLTQTAGAVTATTVYVRLKAGLTSNDYAGTITLTSTGATDVTVNLSGSVIATASLPFSWTGTNSAGKEALDAVTGVEVNLGSDFADSNAPYRLKFDGTTKYVVIYTDKKPEVVAFTAKLFAAASTGSKIKVQESADGFTFTDVQEFTIKGAANATFQFTTTEAFATNSRAIKLIMSAKDQNVGVGTIAITGNTSFPIIPTKEYTTLTSAYPLDFTGLADLEAYIVKDNDASDGYVTLTQVNNVPANTGLVLKASSTGSLNLVPVLTGAADDVDGNKMAGSATATTAIVANAGYILSDGAFHPASAGTLPAGKAYLAISVSAPVLNLSFDGDDITGIDQVESGKMKVESSEIYNLNGQRVAQPAKGLYIVNGKKYVVK